MARALVLSGGGVKGAFQAGVVHRLAEAGNGPWEVVCGVSAGALNALMAAQERFDDMLELWEREAGMGLPTFRTRLDAARVALDAVSPGLLAYADIASLDGVYSNRALAELVEPFAAALLQALEAARREVRFGVVCLQTGEYVAADPRRDVAPTEVARLVLASTAIPVAFDPVELTIAREGLACSGRRCQFVDGGVRNVTPLADAITAARSGEIELEGIDVVLASPLDPEGAVHEFHGLLDIALRAEEIAENEIYRNDLELFRHANALADLARRLEDLSTTNAAARELLERLEAHGLGIRRYRPLELRLVRPTLASWRRFTGRDDADLLGEFPSALDRNGELVRLILGYGRWLAEHPEHHLFVRPGEPPEVPPP